MGSWLKMMDAWGDGWSGAVYTFTHASDGSTSTGTLYNGAAGTAVLCLAPADGGGRHTFKVSAGAYPTEVGWSVESIQRTRGPFT